MAKVANNYIVAKKYNKNKLICNRFAQILREISLSF